MSYSRWSFSNWYIFWTVEGREKIVSHEDERLAIWGSHCREIPNFTFRDVSKMLESGDFSSVPGFRPEDPEDKEEIEEACGRFIADVLEAWKDGKPKW